MGRSPPQRTGAAEKTDPGDRRGIPRNRDSPGNPPPGAIGLFKQPVAADHRAWRSL
ncbi:hypothetical protein [Laspinema olomoucense]|uniref:Uncharacterized protein n=1 Tax=Laspinema olomoucense D3b TaxID=2953688 RepID=A0ABT2NB28_9CYAN|nr:MULTISPECIES: hypothetical protein [unclassified Laspinema]MCT7978471.1 hypothetical protein [Laspinema sp. D3b]MCT7991106.1 hypothetical protein [Laspinema sp. D3a]